MSDNRERADPVSFVSSIFKFSIATWINAALYAAAVFAVNLFIDKTIHGPYDLMISAAITLMSVVTIGLDHAYIRFFHEPPSGAENYKQISAAGILTSLISLTAVSAVVLLVIPNQIGMIFFEGQRDVILLISTCLITLFMVIIRFFNITYRMKNNVLMFSVVSISLQFFTRLFYILGVLVKPNLITLIMFSLIGLGGFTIYLFLSKRKDMLPERYKMSYKAYVPLIKYGAGLAPSSVLLWGNQLVNKLFVEAGLGDGALGIFSFAALISQALGIIQGGFANYWSAYIFENYNNEQERIKRMHDFVMFPMMIMMCLLILLSPVIFLLLSNYAESRSIFGIMLIAPLLMIIAETTVYGIEIAKRTYLNSLGSLICFAVNVLCCIIFIPGFQLVGAAMALAVSTAAMFIFRTAAAQRFYRTIPSYAKTSVSLIVITSLAVMSCFFDGEYMLISGISAAAILFYIIIYKKECVRLIKLFSEILGKRGKK